MRYTSIVSAPPRNVLRLAARALLLGLLCTILTAALCAVIPIHWTAPPNSQSGDCPVGPQDSNLRFNTTLYSTPFIRSQVGYVSNRKMGSKPLVPLLWWSGFDQNLPWDTNPIVLVEASGWPLPAFRATFFSPSTNLTDAERNRRSHIPTPGIPLLKKVGFHLVDTYEWPDYENRLPWTCPLQVIPTHPIWLGILVNTLCFASPFFFIPFAIHLSRSHIRRRRGRCVRCNYDLHGVSASACPECGAPH